MMPLPSETPMASGEYRAPSLPLNVSAPLREAGVEPDFEDEKDDEVPSLAHEIQEVPAAPSTLPTNRAPPLSLRPPATTYRTPQRDQGAHSEEDFNPLGQWGARGAAYATVGSVRSQRGGPGRSAPAIGREPGRAPSMKTSVLVQEPEGNSDARRMYYRVYSSIQGVTVLQAQRPISHAEPSLTYLKPTHIAPPYTVRNIKRVICSREGVHSSRATLYLTAPRETNRPPPDDLRVDIYSDSGSCPGERPENPMHFTVEMADLDDDPTQPLSARGAFWKWWRSGCIGNSIECLFACPCNAISVWCDICAEDCKSRYARRAEPTQNASIV